MSNFSIVYFKKFYVFQIIERKTTEWLVNNDFEGKWKERLAEKNWGIRGFRLEELRKAILNSTQNIQQDVPNNKHGFLTPQPRRIFRKTTSFPCKSILLSEYARLVNRLQVGISLIKRAMWADFSWIRPCHVTSATHCSLLYLFFRRVRKITNGFVVTVRPSAWKKLCSHWTVFHEIWY
jgi:hypothetical protein